MAGEGQLVEFTKVLNGLVLNFTGDTDAFIGSVYLNDFGSNNVYYVDNGGLEIELVNNNGLCQFESNKGLKGNYRALNEREVMFSTNNDGFITFSKEGKNILFFSEKHGDGVYSKIGGSYFFEGEIVDREVILIFSAILLFDLIELE